LDPGTYVPTTSLVFPEPRGRTFFIGKALTLKGSAPGVVLSGDLGATNAFNVVVIDASASPGPVNLENLTIRDGDSTDGGFFVGGGIVAGNNQIVRLDKVTVEYNAASFGGGIWPGGGADSSWAINLSRFKDNFAAVDGGAIRASGTDILAIDNSEFDGNSVSTGFGGAVHFTGGQNSFGAIEVRNSTFTNNTAAQSGGAMTIQAVGFNRSYLVDNCTFGDNSVTDLSEGFGGAIDIFSIIGDGRISGSSFYRNTATIGGGAIYITHGHAVIDGSVFWENSASEIGGAVGIQGNANGPRTTNVTLEKNAFNDNVAGVGGAIFSYNLGVRPTSGLTFNKNHYNRNSANLLGAVAIIALDSPNENVTMSKEHFNFNWAATSWGALGMQGVSGRIDEIYFNHNDAGTWTSETFRWLVRTVTIVP
jgi:predicted outer membrane repeat protein